MFGVRVRCLEGKVHLADPLGDPGERQLLEDLQPGQVPSVDRGLEKATREIKLVPLSIKKNQISTHVIDSLLGEGVGAFH